MSSPATSTSWPSTPPSIDAIDEGDVCYLPAPELTTTSWGLDGGLYVTDLDGNDLVEFGLAFLLRERCDNWQYIRIQLSFCWDLGSEGHFLDDDGRWVDEDQPLRAGWFAFTGKVIGRHRGPLRAWAERWEKAEREEEKAKKVEETESPTKRLRMASSSSHVSNISRPPSSSGHRAPNQSDFRWYLGVRDGRCPLTKAGFPRCEAAHIVPHSRPEYYALALGAQPPHLYAISYGLLLEKGIHGAFDNLEIALWPRDDHFEVHVFEGQRQFHGKKIDHDHFKCEQDQLPDRRLLLFHYKQCAMAHFRRAEGAPKSRPPADLHLTVD